MKIPFDWWGMFHVLIREKNWTPDQIKRLTMNDLRVMSREHAPPEPGGGGGRITNSAELAAYQQRIEREKNSWLSQ